MISIEYQAANRKDLSHACRVVVVQEDVVDELPKDLRLDTGADLREKHGKTYRNMEKTWKNMEKQVASRCFKDPKTPDNCRFWEQVGLIHGLFLVTLMANAQLHPSGATECSPGSSVCSWGAHTVAAILVLLQPKLLSGLIFYELFDFKIW